MKPFERVMLVNPNSYIISDQSHNLISNYSVAILPSNVSGAQIVCGCMVTFGQNLSYIDRVCHILTRSMIHGAVVGLHVRVDRPIFCCLSTMHERDRQTNRQADRQIGSHAVKL